MRVGAIRKGILPGVGRLTGVEISIGELEFSRGGLSQQFFVVFDGEIHAGNIKVFSLAGRNLEIERPERSDLRHKPENKCQQARSEAGTSIPLAPFPLIVGTRQIVAELARPEVWSLLYDLAAALKQCHASHLRDHLADGAPECAEGQISLSTDLGQRILTGVFKVTLHHRLSTFQA